MWLARATHRFLAMDRPYAQLATMSSLSSVERPDLNTTWMFITSSFYALATNLLASGQKFDTDTIGRGPRVEHRYRHEIICDGKKIIVFGGGTRDTVFGFQKLDCFDLTTRQWTAPILTERDEANGFPRARKCHGVIHHGSRVYIFGGQHGAQWLPNDQDPEVQPPELLDDYWVLDLSTLRWRCLAARLPRPLFFHAACVTNDGCIYSHGGVVNAQTTDRTNACHRAWLQPPSLQWLSARVLLNTSPELAFGSPRHLRRVGIPAPLADWIAAADTAA